MKEHPILFSAPMVRAILDGKNPNRLDLKTWYRNLWVEINGIESWEANPWVWVIEFKRVE